LGCLFCGIVEGKIPAQIVYETESLLAFNDIHPQAPVHALVIPKKHLEGIHQIKSVHSSLAADLLETANKLACHFKIQDSGYRLVFNCGSDGGQTVDHLHLHLLGGRQMNWPPG